LEPGDMLYLPPLWGHEGVAQEPCMTCSVGFQAPGQQALATGVLQRLLEAHEASSDDATSLYHDPREAATATPGAIANTLGRFAQQAVGHLLKDRCALKLALGEFLTEPKPHVWFEPNERALTELSIHKGVKLDRRSRLMYDDEHLFLNGEALRAQGRDATLMRELADKGALTPQQIARLSSQAQALLMQWWEAGWVQTT
jgi:50S ribosomal protein L16 3-hydroxylase